MALILVADDDLESRETIEQLLICWGHEVITCEEGNSAWRILLEKRPAVAILDWFMPGKNGLELCRNYQSDDELDFIYMILLSHRAKTEDLFEAVDKGAHDFLGKPADPHLLKARLTAGVKLCKEKRKLMQANKDLNIYASQLEEVANQRAKQLVHADRTSTLGIMVAGIAHEINNPLSFIGGNAQTLERFWSDLQPVISDHQSRREVPDRKIAFISEEMPKLIQSMKTGVSRVSTIIKGLKSYSGRQRTEKAATNINECILQAIQICNHALKGVESVEKMFAENLPDIYANAQEIEQVIVNFIINAAHALEGRRGSYIGISSQLVDGEVAFSIDDNGPGIPDDVKESIWNPFFTTKEIGKGTGLGLSISQGIITDHRGSVAVKDREGGGTRFIAKFPVLCERASCES